MYTDSARVFDIVGVGSGVFGRGREKDGPFPPSHACDRYSHASSNARARSIGRVLIRTSALAVVSKRRGVNRMYKINW